tara:strand:- start:8384 stop:9940 length:1557 start_codon:yes stop_codon:yes gene_type:complete
MDKQKFKLKAQKLLNQFNVGNYQLVIKETNSLLKKMPANLFLMNLIGSCFQKIGDLDRAKRIFEDIIAMDNKNIAAYNNLGNTLKNLKDFNGAEKNYKNALKIDSNYSNTLQNYANLKFELNQNEESLQLYNQAVQSDSKNYLIHYNLGLVYQAIGEFNNARKSLMEVIKLNPKFTNADKILSRFTKYEKNNEHLADMENRLQNIDLTGIYRANILFSLGKACEDTTEYEKSYKYLEQANKVMKTITKYNFENDEYNFKCIKKIFEKNIKNIETKNDDRKLIFIVGLPRSGTSLIEQILASHTNIYGAGELPFLSDSIKREFFKNNIFFKDKIDMDNDREKLKRIKNNFFHNIKNYKYNEKFITDKNPLNFLWIGFIKLIFPQSKIIHIRRNLSDNFFSLYKNSFDGNMNWCYDKKDLFNYCSNYKKLMEFWNSTIPEFLFNINYEDLITNSEIEIKKILSFCDLEWESNCLEFYKTKRAIKTVSSAQARKPIYKSSVNSFQNYNDFLGDYFRKIEDL